MNRSGVVASAGAGSEWYDVIIAFNKVMDGVRKCYEFLARAEKLQIAVEWAKINHLNLTRTYISTTEKRTCRPPRLARGSKRKGVTR